MKEFSLEEYLSNPNRKIVTRDGRKVTRFLCTDAKGPFPIVALVETYNNSEYPYPLTKEGKDSPGINHSNDLFFITERHEGWINVYRNGEHLWCGDINRTETEAKEFGDSKFYKTTIKIEWEE